MANFEKDFNKKMEDVGYSITYYDNYMNDVEADKDKCTNIYVGLHVKNGSIAEYGKNPDTFDAEFIGKTIRVPKKKEITMEYIIGKLSNNVVYENFSRYFKSVLVKLGYNGINVYPTSYGIGMFVLFSDRTYMRTAKNEIDTLLKEMGVEYTNEYSDAAWVFRYKISKSEKNISKLKQLIQ